MTGSIRRGLIPRSTYRASCRRKNKFSALIDCVERHVSHHQRSVSPISWTRMPETPSILWIMPQSVPIVDPVDVLIGEFNICALQVSSARAGRSCQQRHRARRRRCCRGRGSNNSIGGQPQAPLPLDGHLRRASHPPARRIQTIAWGFECPRCRQSCARSDAPAKMSSLLQND